MYPTIALTDLYEEQFSSAIDYSFAEFNVMTEGDGIINKVKQFFTRVVMFFDTYLTNMLNLRKRSEQMLQLAVWYSYWDEIYQNLPSNKKKMFVEYHMSWKLKDTESDFFYNMARNLNTLFLYKREIPEAYELYRKLYHKRAEFTSSKDDEDCVYKVPFKTMMQTMEETYVSFSDEIEQIRKSLRSFSTIYQQSKDRSFDESFFYRFFHGIACAVKMKTISSMYNLRSFCTGVGEISKEFITQELADRSKNFEKMSNDPKRSKEFKELLKKSKYITSYKFGKYEIKVWQFPIDGPSCFNLEGFDVFVDGSFFKYSRPLQKAIIYHEIGHLASGHFKTFSTPDLGKRMENLIIDYNKFVNFVNTKATFRHGEDEFIYLLDEMDADRYAAKRVGKHTMKKSLNYRFQRQLYMTVNDIHNLSEEEALLIAYNKERMKLRSYMM